MYNENVELSQGNQIAELSDNELQNVIGGIGREWPRDSDDYGYGYERNRWGGDDDDDDGGYDPWRWHHHHHHHHWGR